MTNQHSVPLLEAESLAFFEPGRRVFGIAGPQVSVMFSGEGDSRRMGLSAGEDAGQLEMVEPGHWRGRMHSESGSFRLHWTAREPIAPLDGGAMVACDVSGRLTEQGGRERRVKSFGAASLVPRREATPILRSIAVIFDNDDCFFMNAHRPDVYRGHGDERNEGVLIEQGEALAIADVRLSTVFDNQDLQTQASLELWLDGDELPRRISGSAVPGTHIELSDRGVVLAFFDWMMGARKGIGYYEIEMTAPARRAA